MDRSTLTSRRVVIGGALAVALTAGVGLAAVSLASDGTTPLSYRGDTNGLPSTGSRTAGGSGTSSGQSSNPSSNPAPTSSPAQVPAEAAANGLTIEEATAIAVQFAPGRVVEVDQDRDFLSGLRYDVTVLHDNGTSTQVEVDADSGQVVSTDFDNDWD
ncbi:MAG: hypothetical protein JWR62_3229 [Modestobacter sp.]|jgi:hypothetical protein|nr:hypothetical protein [Modestobacter sp.]